MQFVQKLPACSQLAKVAMVTLFCFRFVTLHSGYLLQRPGNGASPVPPSFPKTFPKNRLMETCQILHFVLFFFLQSRKNDFTWRWKPGSRPVPSSSLALLARPSGDGGTVMFMNPFNVLCNYPGNTSHDYSRQ